jgi:hypothetical protein
VDGVAATFALVLLRDETVPPAVGFPAKHPRSGLDGQFSSVQAVGTSPSTAEGTPRFFFFFFVNLRFVCDNGNGQMRRHVELIGV